MFNLIRAERERERERTKIKSVPTSSPFSPKEFVADGGA